MTTAAPVTDDLVLDTLDFAVPCETDWADDVHPEDHPVAVWALHLRCPCGNRRLTLACQGCLDDLCAPTSFLTCARLPRPVRAFLCLIKADRL